MCKNSVERSYSVHVWFLFYNENDILDSKSATETLSIPLETSVFEQPKHDGKNTGAQTN